MGKQQVYIFQELYEIHVKQPQYMFQELYEIHGK
jgi:hypothetical protein